jgi:RecA-family ATPase
MSVCLDVRQLAVALDGEVSGNEVLAPGPGHSKQDRSLSVKLDSNAPDGFVVHSFAGDDPIECRDYVREQAGLDPFKPGGDRRRPTSNGNRFTAQVSGPQHPYDYRDRDGHLLYQVVRYNDPKTFLQRRPDGSGGWTWKLDGLGGLDGRRVLYKLPDLLQYPDATVFVCEGEKDSDRVAELDKGCATTVASGKWTDECVQALAGRDIIILEDNDDAGRRKALDAATRLHGVAASVRIVRLPGLPEGGDVSDWLDAGHDADDLVDFCFSPACPVWAPGALIEQIESPSLPFINVRAWHNQPVPAREWCVLNRIPMRNVTLFSGEGAIGKSIVSLQLAVAHALGQDWLNSMPEPGPAMVVCCEDDEHELQRRLSDILRHHGASFADLKDMHIVSMAGRDALMAVPDRSGLIRPTKLLEQLVTAGRDIRPKLIVLDNSADVFGGNENDRAQVRQFIGILRGLAIAANTGVVLTSHPSLTGQNSGSGLSGSTAWHASVRSRLYMRRAATEKDEEPDPNLRVIEVMKSNYGPVGEIINMRWKDGVFVPVTSMGNFDRRAAEQADEDLFLKLLDRWQEQGRSVSDKSAANNYAPKMFATDPDGKGKRKALTDAMARLFAAGKIKVENYGRPSRPNSRLVRCG